MVDKSILGTSVAIFMFSGTIIASCSTFLTGYFSSKFDLSPTETPKEYGYLLAAFTIIPDILAMPCFLAAGYKYVKARKE